MKILAIMGSPRGRGKGYEITRMIESGMKARGGVDFEYLFLNEGSLRPCLGCYACLAKGEDKCPLADGRSAIEQKMLAADGIILSTPVYVLNVSGLMKNFIDRFAYTSHRPRFFSQKILTVANSGGSGQKRALASMKNALGGARVVGELGVATPMWPQSDFSVVKKTRRIAKAAENFYEACLDSTRQKPSLIRYATFLVQKRFFEVSKQFLTADHAHYTGKGYYYEAKVHPIVKVLAQALAGLMSKPIKEMGPGNTRWPIKAGE